MPGSTSTLARVTVEVEDGIVNSPTSHNISSASSAAGTCWKLNRRNRTLALVALVAMSVALGLALSRRENKIDRDLIPSHVIGGSVAGPDRYSYAVSLQNSYGHFCGGSLITRDIVLTAAHCWEGFFDPITGEADPNLKAVAGRHDLDDVYNGESIPILGNSPHPDYMKAVYLNNDFMLLALETGFTAGNVELVKLNSDASRPCVGQDLTAMGWGEVDPHVCRDPLSPLLKHLNVNVVSNELCKLAEGFVNGTDLKYETFITDNVLCAWANQEGNCQGDSGGPLVIKGADAASDVQVGVVSFGGDCASLTLPGVYARVSEAYDWIRSEVCAFNSITANEAGFDCPLVSTYSPTASPITYAPTFTSAPTVAPIQCNKDFPCAEGMCCSVWGVSLHTFF